MKPIDQLAQSGRLRRVDLALADWIARAFPAAAPEVALAAALAARAVADGHSALELTRAQSWLEGLDGTGRVPELPALDPWLALLRAAPPELPLVCDAQGRVYLRRYFEYERGLAQALVARAAAAPDFPLTNAPSPPTEQELVARAAAAPDLPLTEAPSPPTAQALVARAAAAPDLPLTDAHSPPTAQELVARVAAAPDLPLTEAPSPPTEQELVARVATAPDLPLTEAPSPPAAQALGERVAAAPDLPLTDAPSPPTEQELVARVAAAPDLPLTEAPSPPTAQPLGERDGERGQAGRVRDSAPSPNPLPRSTAAGERASSARLRTLPAGQRRAERERGAQADVTVDPAQQRAIGIALDHRLALVTGGPGTGKTWSVVRMLVALATRAAAHGDSLKIALAAPTGKAAARLRQSVHAQLETLRLPADVAAQMPPDATTVHRLLCVSPWHSAPKHDRSAPLAEDVIVVDEVSMVDLPLMMKLVDAVAPEAHLILLGDPRQLAAVEAGNVLGALTAAADAPPLADCHVALSVNHRFGADSALGQLASAIATGNANAALACLQSGGGDVGLTAADLRALVAAAAEAYLPIAQAGSPATALAAARSYRVLTALRRGPAGCLALDGAIGASIVRRLGLAPGARWWRGRLVLITANRSELRLFNGDTGVVWPDADGAPRVWFEGIDGTLQALAPAALPPHEGAFALTVHKAQGSEFERVALVTGPDSAVLTRELLYTGVTRARSGITLYATAATLRTGIERRTLRMTGLADRLREGAAGRSMASRAAAPN